MTNRAIPLNPAQREVLAWVQEGCPADVYGNWSHRVSARAPHNRGLVVVRGHGPDWSASLTDEGHYYLEHGSYPDEVQDHSVGSSPQSSLADERRDAPAARQATSPLPERRRTRPAPPAKQPGKTEQLILALDAADGHQLVAPRSEESSYRRLASLAKRRGLIRGCLQLAIS